MPNRRLMVFILLLVLSLFACNFIGDSISDQDKLATQVSETLTAQAPDDIEPTTAQTSQAPSSPEPHIPPTDSPPPPHVLRIVYTNGGNVWMIEGSGVPQQITASGDAKSVLISSDGMKIVFTRRPTPDKLAELRSVNADGSGEMVLLSIDDMKSLYPQHWNRRDSRLVKWLFYPNLMPCTSIPLKPSRR